MSVESFAGFPMRDSLPRGFAFLSFMKSRQGGGSGQAAQNPPQASSVPAASASAIQTNTGSEGGAGQRVSIEHLGRAESGNDRIRIVTTGADGAVRTVEREADPRTDRSYDLATGQFDADPNAGLAVFNAENNFVGTTTEIGADAKAAEVGADAGQGAIPSMRPGTLLPMKPVAAAESAKDDRALLSALRSRQ